MIEEYFSRYRGIVIHVLASRIVVDGPGSASLETDVSLSSGAAQAFRKLIRFSRRELPFPLPPAQKRPLADHARRNGNMCPSRACSPNR